MGFPAAFGDVKLSMRHAEGAGKTTLADGREAIAFEVAAPDRTSATWRLASPLAAGWHTVDLEFGPETNTRKLVDFQCLDAEGQTILSVNLYHAPSRTAGDPLCRFGIHLPRPATTIRWRKNQTRPMRSAPVVGLRIREGRPDPGSAFMEAVAPGMEAGRLRFPEGLGGGHFRAIAETPVSLLWEQVGKDPFPTPQAVETTAFLDGELRELRVLAGSPEQILLERRFEGPSPIGAEGLDAPLIPLFDGKRTRHVIEITGSHLDASKVSIADFPDGARMAAVQSWDDGVPQDKRAAELLQRHGWRATFFFNRRSAMVDRWKELTDLGMEIGSHSWSHPFYPLQSPRRCQDESVLMRKFLESRTGHPVISFAYPFNYGPAFDPRGDYVLRAQRDAGYLACRTTMNGPLSLDDPGDPLVMKPNAHFLAGRERIESEWSRAANAERGVFYLWGHAYEMSKDADWEAFEEMLRSYGRRPGVWYAAQGDLMVWKHMRDHAQVSATGDARRLIVRVDAAAPHSWWAKRVPLSIRVPGRAVRATADGKPLHVADGVVQFHQDGWDSKPNGNRCP